MFVFFFLPKVTEEQLEKKAESSNKVSRMIQ